MSASPVTKDGYAGRKACAWCGEEMEPERDRFCSERCIDEAARSNPCTYCGAAASDQDHVIPQSRRPDFVEYGGWKAVYPDVPDTVPSCAECNGLAGAKLFNSVDEKRDYIHLRLEKRYGRVMGIPQWEKEGLDELGPTLRAYVTSGQALAQSVKARLAWPREV